MIKLGYKDILLCLKQYRFCFLKAVAILRRDNLSNNILLVKVFGAATTLFFQKQYLSKGYDFETY